MTRAVEPASLLARARQGDPDAPGELLALYRNYLRMLAQPQIDRFLRVRCDASDLVQETMLEAIRDFRHFGGTTEKELIAWLRKILVRNLADEVKRHKAKARDVQKQESLEALLDHSCQSVQDALARGVSSPSTHASRREEAVLLAHALARLTADYHDVIVMRNLQGLAFDEIALRMNRSAGAVRMLWLRALERLQRELECKC